MRVEIVWYDEDFDKNMPYAFEEIEVDADDWDEACNIAYDKALNMIHSDDNINYSIDFQ